MDIIHWLFGQYADYSPLYIGLELIAVVFGVISVVLASKTNLLAFPIGIISTAIFVYLLWQWQLFGDMFINAYYTVMSLYGWLNWSKHNKTVTVINDKSSNHADSALQIESMTRSDLPIMALLGSITFSFVALVYYLRPVINNGFSFDGVVLGIHLFTWVDYTDMLTTALFLMAMWLMARRKIEHWIVWIIADAISVPLYFYKGLTFTALQYLVFTFIAIWAYYEWQRRYRNQSRFKTAYA